MKIHIHEVRGNTIHDVRYPDRSRAEIDELRKQTVLNTVEGVFVDLKSGILHVTQVAKPLVPTDTWIPYQDYIEAEDAGTLSGLKPDRSATVRELRKYKYDPEITKFALVRNKLIVNTIEYLYVDDKVFDMQVRFIIPEFSSVAEDFFKSVGSAASVDDFYDFLREEFKNRDNFIWQIEQKGDTSKADEESFFLIKVDDDTLENDYLLQFKVEMLPDESAISLRMELASAEPFSQAPEDWKMLVKNEYEKRLK